MPFCLLAQFDSYTSLYDPRNLEMEKIAGKIFKKKNDKPDVARSRQKYDSFEKFKFIIKSIGRFMNDRAADEA